MKQRTKENGGKNDNWETPQEIYEYIKRNITNKELYDPCPLNAEFDG